LRNTATLLLYYSGLLALSRRVMARRGRFVLVFHGVAGRHYPELPAAVQPHHTAGELRQTLRWLAARFPFLTPAEFLAGERPGVLLTFDDGFANNATHALPVLEEFGAPALFFVATQHIANPRNWLPAIRQQVQRQWPREEDVLAEVAAELFDGMSTEQLATFAAHPLVTIGAHTVSHPFLTSCGDDQLAYEMVEARRFLEEVSGRPVLTMAYPTGDYNRRVAQAAQAAGYETAYAVDKLPVGMPRYEIERVGLYQPQPAYLGAKLSGLHRRPLRQPFLSFAGPS
jgi:peptidoglycan/xylan/chitin deacetylase (PgdA/CDA1 family)